MRLYLATGNRHKIAEVAAILAASGLKIEVLPPAALGGMPEVVEDTGSFVGNALKKAQALARLMPAGSLALADDSGVCVDALGGEPGVESAYYAGKPCDDRANNSRLLAELLGVPAERRGAAFHSCIVVVDTDGKSSVFEGRCPGRILEVPQGTGGFGYDPLFQPDGFAVSYAELDEATKNRISHRSRALVGLVEWLRRHPQVGAAVANGG